MIDLRIFKNSDMKINILFIFLNKCSDFKTVLYEKCDASQQKVPYVDQAYFEILGKIACKLQTV